MPASPAHRPLARWRWSIVTAFGLGGITISAWGPRLPAIKSDLGIGTIVGGVAATPLLHWLEPLRALAVAQLLMAAALAVIGLALVVVSVPLIEAGFVIAGFGMGIQAVTINVEGSAVERLAGRSLLPMMHGGWSVGVAVGAGIGAGCAAAGITPSTQLFIESVVIAAVALAIGPGFPPGRRDVPEPVRRSRGDRVRQWLRGWLDWRLLLIGLVMLGVELGEGSANNWLTLAVRDDHGQTAAVAALFLAGFAVGEATTRILGGRIVDRLGRVRTIRLTTALGVVGVVAFIEASSPWLVLAGVLLWSVGVSMGFPLGMSAAAESGPDPAARVSVVASIGFAANLAGPPVIGVLAESIGLLRALWLIAALFLAAFAAAGALRATPDPKGTGVSPLPN